MKFDNDYLSSLDKKGDELRYDPNSIGMSHGVMQEGALAAVKTSVFSGAPNVEITFFGTGKGHGKNTPESYGKNERDEIRQMTKVNEVDLSIHAAPDMPLAGFSQQGNAFSEESREFSLQEIKRTLDFAADTAGGGPVVVHLDGFPRPVFETDEKGRFEALPGEEEKAPIRFVDEKTGQVMGIARDRKISLQSWDKKKGDYERNPDGTYKIRELDFKEVTNQYIALPDKEKENLQKNWNVNDPMSYLYYAANKTTFDRVQGERRDFAEKHHRYRQQYDQYDGIEKSYETLKREVPEKEHVRALFVDSLKKQRLAPPETLPTGELNPDYQKFLENPVEHLKEVKKDVEGAVQYYSAGIAGIDKQTQEFKESLGNTKPIEEYGREKEADTIARAALAAYKIEKDRELEKPLWIAPENWAIERYGSHPKEYKKVINESRDIMRKQLVDDGMDKKKAKKVANEHIRATFDTGHFNMWRRFHKKSDKEFESWMMSNVRDLVKDDIIGHVHLTDNFGFYDEHLELGEGNTPNQEFMDELKKEKFKGKLIAEPGGQRPGHMHRVWTSALRLAGSPMYRVGITSDPWTSVQSGYFGKTQSPQFVVGDYAPSKDWTLWSETPFE